MSATAKSGYRFTSNESGSVTVNSNQTISIGTEPIPVEKKTFSWSIGSGVAGITVNGQTYTSSGSISVDKGSKVTWSAFAEQDCIISGSSSGTVTMNSDQSVSVTAQRFYTISVSGSSNIDSITINGQRLSSYGGTGVSGEVKALEGSTVSVSFVATTPSSYTISTPGGSTSAMNGGGTSFTMPSRDCSVSVY